MDQYKNIKFKVIKDIFWDNWGHSVKAFSKGMRCEGKLYNDGSIIAMSPYYDGITDIIDPDCINYEEGVII